MRIRSQPAHFFLCVILILIVTASGLCQTVLATGPSQIIDTNQTGTIVIHKYEEDDYLDTMTGLTEEEIAAYIHAHPDELKPLEGVRFRYIKVADLVQYTNLSDGGSTVKTGYSVDRTTADFLGLDEAKADIVKGQHCYDASYLDEMLNRKSASETETFVTSRNAALSNATAEDGTARISDLPLGLYLICEYVYPATALADNNCCAPFFVSLPSTDLNKASEVYWDYTVEVAPKNMLEYIRSDKVIVGPEGDETKEYDAEIGEAVSFLIRSDIPNAIGKLKTYQIIDTLSEGLTFNEASISVHAVSDDGQRTRLSEGEEYSFSGTGELCWNFHADSLANSDGWSAYDSIEIRYTAQLNEKAVVGQDGNPNTVKTVYSKYANSEATESLETVTPDEPARLYTYAIELHKVGSDTQKALCGVTFELQDAKGDPMKLTEQAPGQYCLDPEGSATLTTDENGNIYVKGLEAGTYYLRETATNNPLYSLLTGKIAVTISSNECSYSASPVGTYAPANPAQTYCTDSIRKTNYFILPDKIQAGTFVCFGVSDVTTQPDGAEITMYEQDQLCWSANFTMGGRSDGADSGVVKLEVTNNRILLPATGGDGDFLAIMLGICIIAAGTILFALSFVRRKKNKNNQDRSV